MSLADFVKHLSNTNICKYRDNAAAVYAFKNQPVPELNVFEFEIDQAFLQKPSTLAILVNQMGDRLSKRRGKEFEPSWFSIIVAKKSENNN